MVKLNVKPSSVTKPPFADFIAILHPNKMKELKVEQSDYIILKNTVKKDGEEPKELKISSPLISSTDKLIDKNNLKWITNEDDISLDLTYRSALGVNVGDTVDIEIPKKKMGWNAKFLDMMNYQKSVVRVQTNATYMERRSPIVCICEEMLNSIGATYGDEIVIESHKKKIKARCTPLAPLMQKFHDYVSNPSHDKNKHDELGKEIAGYFTVPSDWNLQSEIDRHNGDLIHPIFMDSVGRKSLRSEDDKIFPLHPVKIHRSFRWEIQKKLNSFGSISLLALSVTAFGILNDSSQIVPWILSGIFAFWGGWSIVTSSKYKTSIS